MASGTGNSRGADPLKPTKPPKRPKLSDAQIPSVLASECIKLHLVSSADDLLNHGGASTSEDLSFSPVYLEQFFGDDGRIHGFKDLKVDVWLHARSFHAYADVHFTSQIRSSTPKRTNLQSKLRDIFKGSLVEDRETFINNFTLYDRTFKEMIEEDGEVVTSWEELPNTDPKEPMSVLGNRREIRRFDLEKERVKEWQSRMSCLALLYIDGANAIDVDDLLWEVYVCIELNFPPQDGGVAPLAVAGFSAVYRFYHHPDSTRLRLSQILVLPPYQGRQYGFRLVEAVNSKAVERNCYDVTMEDPSESLQAVRDCMDVLRLNVFDPVKPAIQAAIAKLQSYATNQDGESVGNKAVAPVTDVESTIVAEDASHDRSKELLLPPRSLVEAARTTFKISSLQLKRCWEVLLYMYLESCDTAVDKALKDLLISRLKSQIVGRGKGKKRSHRGKHVIVTDNEYGNEKTFVMLRANPKEVQAIVENHRVGTDGEASADLDGNGDSTENLADEEEGKPDPTKVEEAVEALLKQRLAEIETVARKVHLLCLSRGDSVYFGREWCLRPPESKCAEC